MIKIIIDVFMSWIWIDSMNDHRYGSNIRFTSSIFTQTIHISGQNFTSEKSLKCSKVLLPFQIRIHTVSFSILLIIFKPKKNINKLKYIFDKSLQTYQNVLYQLLVQRYSNFLNSNWKIISLANKCSCNLSYETRG